MFLGFGCLLTKTGNSALRSLHTGAYTPFLLTTAGECSDFIALLYFTASSAIVLSKHPKAAHSFRGSCLTSLVL